jgi:endonuclease G
MKYTLNICIPWASLLLSLAVTQSALAQKVHIAHCLAGCPAGAPAANEIVVRHLFAASINYQSGLADWVAYRVLPGSIGVASLLPRSWEVDELLNGAARTEVESGPRFIQPDLSNQQDGAYRINEIIINAEDRGRLVPMSSFAGTPFWEDLNYLSNMAPLPSDLRVGPWSRLDQAVNEMSAQVGEVYVVSGPLYLVGENLIADGEGGRRPSAYFKFITTEARYAAFIFPQNAPQHSNYCEFASRMESIQRDSGLRLLPQQSEPATASLQTLLGCGSN